MAWATPSTFTTGQVVTAANLNQIRDNLRYLKGLDGVPAIDAGSTWREDSANGPPLSIQNTNAANTYCGSVNFLASSGGTRAAIRAYQAFPGGLEMYTSGTGRHVIWGAAGISGSNITVVPSGVTRRWLVYGVAWNVLTGVGATASGQNVAAGSAALLSDGTHTLTITGITTPGALVISRTAGSATFDVILSIWYF